MPNNYRAAVNLDQKKILILLKSLLVGILAGLVVTLYRFVLKEAETICFFLYDFLRSHLAMIPVFFLLLCAGGYLIGVLVFRYHDISGSGIPQVKGIIQGHFQGHWLSTLLAKFFGGAVSLIAGLSLGREGPSVQLGACIGEGIGDHFSASRTERKVLIASGASAGLAAAFNAPLAGAMFALEEIFKYISPVILLSTLISAVAADFVSKLVFGMEPVFSFDIQSNIPLHGYWLLIVLGIALGLFGAFYNKFLLFVQRLYKKLRRPKLRPIIPFIAAGILGLVFPVVLGGGHQMIESLNPSTGIGFLAFLLIIKFLFSMISFGSGAPGGIFFPLLIMGATIGAIFGSVAVGVFSFDSALFYNFVIIAMAGFFTAIVRAPITGVVLLMEMTGSLSQFLSLTVVCVAAYVTADLMKSTPIYDSLLKNLLDEQGVPQNGEESSEKVTIELVVHYGSPAENKKVKELELPADCLLIGLRRRGKDLIPRGDTMIFPEDYLIFLTGVKREAALRDYLTILTEAP